MSKWRWSFSLALVLVSTFILLSILSFNPFDSSLIFKTTDPRPISNWLGFLGANCSGLLLYYFGCSAILFIPFLLFFAYFVSRNLNFIDYFDRLISFFLLIILTASVMNIYSFEFFPYIYPGGFIGQTIAQTLRLIFEPFEVILFLFISLLSLLILIDQFSLFYFFSIRISNICFKLFNFCFGKIFAGIKKLRVPRTDSVEEDKDIQKIYDDPFWQSYRIRNRKQIQTVKDEDYDDYEEILEDNFDSNEDFLDEDLLEPSEGYKNNNYDDYVLPDLNLFSVPTNFYDDQHKNENENKARVLEQKLERFGINGKVISITHGPVVTLFEYQPAIDTKISTILAREDDLALALQAVSLRIIAPIPGRSVVGFEVAHAKRHYVYFSELLNSAEFQKFSGLLPLILGKDTLGNNIVIDLADMPHLLVGGSTGSGKSVGLNCMLMSLLCKKTPDELKIILIDPKRLEFSTYSDIAHLLFPIVIEPTRALLVLKWAVKVMEERYEKMANRGVRNILEFHNLGNIEKKEMPFIVIIVDELADLMMTAGKDVEYLLARLAQMARAAGIHLIIATQRPSVDIVTGLIKVNFTSRIAFKMTTKIDSRTILDTVGAEKLLGKGDMLFFDYRGNLRRVHGSNVSDIEIQNTVNHIKQQRKVVYEDLKAITSIANETYNDELYDEIVDFVRQKDEISISLLQRAFSIGYNRSAKLVEQLELDGVILPADGSKMRKVIKEHLE